MPIYVGTVMPEKEYSRLSAYPVLAEDRLSAKSGLKRIGDARFTSKYIKYIATEVISEALDFFNEAENKILNLETRDREIKLLSSLGVNCYNSRDLFSDFNFISRGLAALTIPIIDISSMQRLDSLSGLKVAVSRKHGSLFSNGFFSASMKSYVLNSNSEKNTVFIGDKDDVLKFLDAGEIRI